MLLLSVLHVLRHLNKWMDGWVCTWMDEWRDRGVGGWVDTCSMKKCKEIGMDRGIYVLNGLNELTEEYIVYMDN